MAPPNTRVQRTRSSPSAPHSPLTRCPLGSRKLQYVAGIVVAAWLSVGCDLCSNRVIAEVPAPSARLKAVVFQRNCGATTAFSTEVSLLKEGETLGNGSGNVFLADTDHGAAPDSPIGGPIIEVRWLSDQVLVVVRDAKARAFKAETEVAGVEVQYVERRPGA